MKILIFADYQRAEKKIETLKKRVAELEKNTGVAVIDTFLSDSKHKKSIAEISAEKLGQEIAHIRF